MNTFTARPHSTIPQTPASERSVYYDANSEEASHAVHAMSSKDTITQNQSYNEASTAGSGVGEGADVHRNPSVTQGALDARNDRRGFEVPGSGAASAGGPAMSAEQQQQQQQPASNVRDSGFAQGPLSSTNDKSVAFANAPAAGGMTHDQPSPAYDSSNANANALTDIKAPPRASILLHNDAENQGQGQGQGATKNDVNVNEDQPLTSNSASVQRTSTGAFAKGAAVTGPDAQPAQVQGQHERAETAENQLSEKTKMKLSKQELKEAKRMIKVIKSEGAAQEKSIKANLSELTKLQHVQKTSSKDESSAARAHGKALKLAHKMHTKFLDMKAKDEKAAAEEKAKKEQLEASRKFAAEMTEKLGKEAKVYEELNRQFMVDKREREVKLAELLDMKKRK